MKKSVYCILLTFCSLVFVGCNGEQYIPEVLSGRPIMDSEYQGNVEQKTEESKADPGSAQTIGNEDNINQNSVEQKTEESKEDQESTQMTGDEFSLFNLTKFNGGIEDVLYAGNNKLLVYGDIFYLYDCVEDTVIGQYDVEVGRVAERNFFPISDGYALVGATYGNSSNEMSTSVRSLKCWYFDSNLALQSTVDLVDLVKEQGDYMAFAAAVSSDGDKIAITGMQALYLYDVSENSTTKVFDYDIQTELIKSISVSEVCFTEQSGKLAFVGTALLNGKSSVDPMYGTVSLDGSNLVYQTSSEYSLSDEIIAYTDALWFPEAFDLATGKMMITDISGKNARIVDFEGSDTGADGIFGSDHGKFIATITGWSEGSGWRIRIYDSANGKIVCEQNMELDGEKYSTIVCKVRILDEMKECIVVAGRNQETIVYPFFF